jgi:hypothetical protein
MKIRSKNNLYSHRHFTEHLLDVFEKSPWENDLNHKSSSLLIRWLKKYTRNHLQKSTHNRKVDKNLQRRDSRELQEQHSSKECALGRRESQAESLVARQQRGEGLPRDSRNKTGSKGQPAQSHTNWTPGMRGDGGQQETKW